VPLEEHPGVRAELELHGALLYAELAHFGYTAEEADAAQNLLMRAPTVIGPLYFPRERTRKDTAQRSLTGRTMSAAIDGAYLRLYMRAHPARWELPSPGTLGIFHEDTGLLTRLTHRQQRYVMNGKVLGNGVSPDIVKRYLLSHRTYFKQRDLMLMLVAPDVKRMRSLPKAFPTLITVMPFTEQEATEFNNNSFSVPPQEEE